MRFYKKETPNVDDIVMCHVEKIQEYCIYVKLLGYNNIEGMVQLADASTRRKRKSICLLKVNRKYPLLVIRVDENNKYIDLSNKFLSKEDKESATERYEKYHFIINIFKKFLSKNNEGKYEEEEYIKYANRSIWKIQPNKCYEYFVNNYLNDNNFDEFDLIQDEKDIFKSILHESLGDVIFKSTLNFMARNSNLEGIVKLKKIFSKIKDEYDVSVMIDVAPTYYLYVESSDSKVSLDKITDIELYISDLMSKNNCIYKKMDIVTTNSLE